MCICIICVQVTTQTAAISLGGQSSESPQPTASVPTHIPAGELHCTYTCRMLIVLSMWRIDLCKLRILYMYNALKNDSFKPGHSPGYLNWLLPAILVCVCMCPPSKDIKNTHIK